MKAFLAMLYNALPYLLCAVAIFALLWFVYSQGQDERAEFYESEIATLKAGHEAELLRISAANARREGEDQARARIKEREHTAALAAISDKFTKEKSDAETISKRTIDGLRAGAVRLRDDIERANQRAAAGYAGHIGDLRPAVTSAGLGDGTPGGGFDIEDAAAVFEAAGDGDGWGSQLRACQAIVRADRGQVAP